MPSMGILLQE